MGADTTQRARERERESGESTARSCSSVFPAQQQPGHDPLCCDRTESLFSFPSPPSAIPSIALAIQSPSSSSSHARFGMREISTQLSNRLFYGAFLHFVDHRGTGKVLSPSNRLLKPHDQGGLRPCVGRRRRVSSLLEPIQVNAEIVEGFRVAFVVTEERNEHRCIQRPTPQLTVVTPSPPSILPARTVYIECQWTEASLAPSPTLRAELRSAKHTHSWQSWHIHHPSHSQPTRAWFTLQSPRQRLCEFQCRAAETPSTRMTAMVIHPGQCESISQGQVGWGVGP